jgi:copper(I)-binding protein
VALGAIGAVALLAAVACSGEAATPTAAPTSTQAPVAAPAAKISIQDPWVRAATVDAAGMSPTAMGTAMPGMPGMMMSPTAMAGMPMTPTPMAGMGGMSGMDMAGVNSAAYLVLVNSGNLDDALVAAFADVADKTELHLSSMVDGVMKMTPVDEIPVPAGGRTELKPGGLHVMMIGLTRSLKPGDRILLALRFKNSGDQLIVAEVRQP